MAMTVGATKIRILQESCLASSQGKTSREDRENPTEAPPEEPACGT